MSPDHPISVLQIVEVYRKTTSDWNPLGRQSRLRNPQKSLAMLVHSLVRRKENARAYGETYAFKIPRVSDLQNEDLFSRMTKYSYALWRSARPHASGFRLSICSRFGNGRINDRAVTRREFCNDTFKSGFQDNEETTVMQ